MVLPDASSPTSDGPVFRTVAMTAMRIDEVQSKLLVRSKLRGAERRRGCD